MTEETASISEEVAELVQMAGIYLADGAPRTAADRLRKAADLLDGFAALHDLFREEFKQNTTGEAS